MSITSLNWRSHDHTLSRLWPWSWSVDHRTKLGPWLILLIHWSTPLENGWVVSQSILKLIWTFSSLTFYQEFADIDSVEVSDLETQSVLIDVVLVRAYTRRAGWPRLVSPWYFLAPPGTCGYSWEAQGIAHLFWLARLGSVPSGPDTRRTTLVQDAHSCLPSWTAWQEGTLLGKPVPAKMMNFWNFLNVLDPPPPCFRILSWKFSW